MDEKWSYENPIVAFGNYEAEFYFVYLDGSKSEIKTKTEIEKFKEHRFDSAPIKTIRIIYCNGNSPYAGCMIGIELLNYSGKRMLKIGSQAGF